MHFDDFDVEFVVERLRHPLDQSRVQIDAERHVAGLHDHGFCRCGLDLGFIVFGETGGADDVNDAGLCGLGGDVARRGRHREIDHAVGVREHGSRIR